MRILVALALMVATAGVPAALAKAPPPPSQTAAIPTGRAPCGLATQGAELWVAVYETGSVLRLDRAGRVLRRHRVGRWACRIALDDRAAWVTRDQADAVVRVDRRTGRLRTVRVDSPFDVVLAGRSLWVTSFETGTVTRIDARTGRKQQVLDIGGHPAGIAFCGGRVWVGHGRGATWLTAIDPATGRAKQVDVTVPSPGWPRCIRGDLWVTSESAVLRLASRSGRLLAHVELGGTPAEASAGFGGLVFVTDKERSLVHRILPTGNHLVDAFPAGPGAYSARLAFGSLWVTSFAGSDLRRFDP